MFKSYSSNPVIQLARFGPANGRTPFFAKGLDSQAAAATTPKERLMELGKDAVQYEKDVTIGKCKATFAQVIKLLINEKIMIRYRYKVHGGEGQGDSHLTEDHTYKIKNIVEGNEKEVSFEGYKLVREGDEITLIRPRSTSWWLDAYAEKISRDFHLPEGALPMFGEMLLAQIKQDDEALHVMKKHDNRFEYLMKRAEFYTRWTLMINCGTPAFQSQSYYYKPIAAPTVDELFRLLEHAEAKLGTDAYPIFQKVAREHGGFLGERLAPKIVALYDKIARNVMGAEERAKGYMQQLEYGACTAENDAFCSRAIETIAPTFDRMLVDGKPQEALDLLMRVCYENYSQGYNKYSIGYGDFSERNIKKDPLARLKEMNKAAVEKAKELQIELKVDRYSLYKEGEFAVRWA